MKWIMFYQTNYNFVKYQTSEVDDIFSMPYTKFMTFLYNIAPYIKNRTDFLHEFDSFETILLEPETGEWELFKKELNLNVGFETLLALNKPVEGSNESLQDKQLKQTNAIIGKSWDTLKSKIKVIKDK